MRKITNFLFFSIFPGGVVYFSFGSKYTFITMVLGLLLCAVMDKLDEIHDKIK